MNSSVHVQGARVTADPGRRAIDEAARQTVGHRIIAEPDAMPGAKGR